MKKIVYITGAILLSLLMVLWYGCNKEKDTDGFGSIYGTVVEDGTGNAISGARVTLEKLSSSDYGSTYWGTMGSMVSDASGHFKFVDLHTHTQYLEKGEWGNKKVVKQARYQVTVEAPSGYYSSFTYPNTYHSDKTIEVTIEKDRVSRVDFRFYKKEKN